MAAAMVLAWNTARAETPQVGESQAVNGQIADVGSTGIGLLMGAAEANPLGIITLGIKVAAYQQIKEAPPAEQPRLWGMYGAFAALCPVLGRTGSRHVRRHVPRCASGQPRPFVHLHRVPVLRGRASFGRVQATLRR